MTVLYESPWYQEILKEGRGQGIELGAQRPLLRMLKYRFGEAAAEAAPLLVGLNLEQLEDLVDVAMEVESLDAFCKRIPPTS